MLTYILLSALNNLEWSLDELVFELNLTWWCMVTGVPGAEWFPPPVFDTTPHVVEEDVVELREVCRWWLLLLLERRWLREEEALGEEAGREEEEEIRRRWDDVFGVVQGVEDECVLCV